MTPEQILQAAENAVLAYYDPVIVVGELALRVVVRNGIVYVGARGTDNVSNWVTDLKYKLIQVVIGDRTIKFEEGFWQAANSLKEPLGNFMVKYFGMPVIMEGHSLGCPLARVLGDWLKYGGWNVVGQIFLESPQMTDVTGEQYFAARGIPSLWIRHGADLVPNVPGTGKGYAYPTGETWILDDLGRKLDKQPLAWEVLTEVFDTGRDHNAGRVLTAVRLAAG